MLEMLDGVKIIRRMIMEMLPTLGGSRQME